MFLATTTFDFSGIAALFVGMDGGLTTAGNSVVAIAIVVFGYKAAIRFIVSVWKAMAGR